MSYLLSVDPGLRKSGAALWHDGELLAAKLIEPGYDGPNIVEAIGVMAQAACEWCASVYDVNSIESLKPWLRLVCECPRTYGGRAGRGDANDLISVALVAGALLGRLGCPAALPLPEDWKGGIPKPGSKAEYLREGYPVEERAKLKLSPAELARVEWPRDWRKRLDVADALGIGLWSLGRR